MDLQLENKVVLVTGGAKGIGAAIVRAAAAEGIREENAPRTPGNQGYTAVSARL